MKLASAAAALLLVAACPREATSPSSGGTTTMTGQELRIQESTQARVDADLAIGAGNFMEEEGRLTCGLWFISSSAAQEHVRVRAGEVLERAGRRIEVVEVARRDGKGTVALRVSKP